MITRLFHCLTFAAALLMAGQAGAQEQETESLYIDNEYTEKIFNKPRDTETTTKEPMKLGGFLLSAGLNTQVRYNDNILALQDTRRGDFIGYLNPSADLRKDFGRHSATFSVGSEVLRYQKYTDENYENYTARLGGIFEALSSLKLPWFTSYTRDHRDRFNRSEGGLTKEPLEIKRFEAGGGFILQPNRFQLRMLGYYRQNRFVNGQIASTGADFIAKDRDSNYVQLDTSLSYKTHRNWEPYINVIYGADDYLRRSNTNTGFDGVARDNKIIRGRTGINFDYKQLVLGNFGVGWEKRLYDDTSLDTVEGFSMGASIIYKPDQKTQFSFDLGRQTREDNDILSSVEDFTADFKVGYELQQDLLFKSGVRYKFTDFTESEREDNFWRINPSLTYIIKPGLSLTGQYTFTNQDSTRDGFNFDQNVFWIGLESQL